MLGLGFALAQVAAIKTGVAPGPIDVIVTMGDSNNRGQASDEAALAYAPDSQVLTWLASSSSAGIFVQYQPVTGITGMGNQNVTADGHVGPEMQFARAYRAANPSKPLAIIKMAAAGSFLSRSSSNAATFTVWDPADATTLWTGAISRIDAAIAKLVSLGFTPTVRAVYFELGVNDAAYADSAAAWGTTAATVFGLIRAKSWFVAGTTMIVLPRIGTTQPNNAAVRAAQLTAASSAFDVFAFDQDGFGNNGGADSIHYNLAGQISAGNAFYGNVSDPDNLLMMTLGSDALAYWDFSNALTVTLASGAVSDVRDSVGNRVLSQATAANRPTYGATAINGTPAATFDGINDVLSLSGATGLPAGTAGSEVFVLLKQDALAADATSRTALDWGAGTDDFRRTGRTVVSGVNRARSQIGAGGGNVWPAVDTVTDLSGVHVVRSRVTATTHHVAVDGGAETSDTHTPATVASGLSIGAAIASQFWQGSIAAVIVTGPLATQKRNAIVARLRARGGV